MNVNNKKGIKENKITNNSATKLTTNKLVLVVL